jgi:hypothetical protein
MDNPRISHGQAQTTYCAAKLNSLVARRRSVQRTAERDAADLFVIEATQVPTTSRGCSSRRQRHSQLVFRGAVRQPSDPAYAIRGTGGTPLPANDCTESSMD